MYVAVYVLAHISGWSITLNGMEHKKTDCGPDFSGIKHTPTKLHEGATVMLQDCDYQMPQQEYLFSGQVALVTFF